ncbi:MAG: response regulator transcription factor [Bacteroidetes bacterium]|nr:response regulator transcription factor [Bacteroidota bacterium]
MRKTRIFIVDDHPLVSEGLYNILNREDHIEVIGSAIHAKEALGFLKSQQPDIVFLDINLPDISGIELCKKIKQEYPNIKCIALSTFSESSYISRMIENGASGYLLKNSSKEEILNAIQQVEQGGLYLNVSMETLSKGQNKIPFITRREKEVLQCIADGLTNQQIGDKLFVSVTTINTHRKNLLTKFEVNNTAALIKLAIQHQLI